MSHAMPCLGVVLWSNSWQIEALGRSKAQAQADQSQYTATHSPTHLWPESGHRQCCFHVFQNLMVWSRSSQLYFASSGILMGGEEEEGTLQAVDQSSLPGVCRGCTSVSDEFRALHLLEFATDLPSREWGRVRIVGDRWESPRGLQPTCMAGLALVIYLRPSKALEP